MAAEDGAEQLVHVAPGERRVERHDLVVNAAQTPDVALIVVASSAADLGRQVARRAHARLRHLARLVEHFGHPEVAELEDGRVGRHEDVARLDVAVQDLALVQVIESGRQLAVPGDNERLVERHSPPLSDEGADVAARAVLHDEAQVAGAGRFERVEVADDVRVVELRQEPALLVSGVALLGVANADLLEHERIGHPYRRLLADEVHDAERPAAQDALLDVIERHDGR